MNSLTIIPETFKSLKENLDFDDNFHQDLSSTSNYAYLRLWECSTYGIVLGRSNNENIETHFTKVEQDNVCVIKAMYLLWNLSNILYHALIQT